MKKYITAATNSSQTCEFKRMRRELHRCAGRVRRVPMAGVEVAYLALADWLAATGEQAQHPYNPELAGR
ncbi:hypothetical protein FN976_15250 [Caenimonas sedimenti]|uniref:Uncharacterized protein n=1 Tax=Caenimonas sedimenti TaxID=2596921 RepID=A0A562ZP23_9BURK|nr:hypothetical protein [Caenimonas sedimenti]TWO70342.1 hypothetical protein FN976_15250 [Caenimonas sedimenti]